MDEPVRHEAAKNSEFGTPYDDAFKTLLVDCPRLLIPLVNEAFNKSYTGEEKIILRANEHFLPGANFENEKRITDSAFTIIGEKPENYIIECQSSPDSSMTVRMFEYMTQEALDTGELKGDTLHVTIPNAAVLFLRSTGNTPDAMKIHMETPDGDIIFGIRIMKIKAYSLDDIFDKDLYFLLPFYIFVHEKRFKVYNEDENKRKHLTCEYMKFMEHLNQAAENGDISVYDRGTILDMSRRVLDSIAAKYDNVKKGVREIMGGKVLDYETKRIYNAGKIKGIAEGKLEGKIEGETESSRRTARKLYEMGMDIHFIAEAVSAEEEAVKEWVKNPVAGLN